MQHESIDDAAEMYTVTPACYVPEEASPGFLDYVGSIYAGMRSAFHTCNMLATSREADKVHMQKKKRWRETFQGNRYIKAETICDLIGRSAYIGIDMGVPLVATLALKDPILIVELYVGVKALLQGYAFVKNRLNKE